ncbi:hypothetical protein KFK09_003309 [Dendrobium nobile]|uniref:Uncharacterized protein n=1 Tax=Dendrobium nobile TaxID=94219 RepID=A0A8T3C441_DENNO|nr:hypothetical protein KFK09_003309 [Dendrobium nobile]
MMSIRTIHPSTLMMHPSMGQQCCVCIDDTSIYDAFIIDAFVEFVNFKRTSYVRGEDVDRITSNDERSCKPSLLHEKRWNVNCEETFSQIYIYIYIYIYLGIFFQIGFKILWVLTSRVLLRLDE